MRWFSRGWVLATVLYAAVPAGLYLVWYVDDRATAYLLALALLAPAILGTYVPIYLCAAAVDSLVPAAAVVVLGLAATAVVNMVGLRLMVGLVVAVRAGLRRRRGEFAADPTAR